jgi:hypothetical protein
MMRFLEVYKIKTDYVPKVWVKMRMGGVTTKSLIIIISGNVEILTALRKNGLSSNFISFFFHKIILRLSQKLIVFFKVISNNVNIN